MKKILHWSRACIAGSKFYFLSNSFYPFPAFTWNQDVRGFGNFSWLRWSLYFRKPMMMSYLSKSGQYLREYSSLVKRDDIADYAQTEAYWKKRAAENAARDVERQKVLEENYQAAIRNACRKSQP